jgi:hypothetical protein
MPGIFRAISEEINSGFLSAEQTNTNLTATTHPHRDRRRA